MVAVFKMAILSANLQKWKLSFLQSAPKYVKLHWSQTSYDSSFKENRAFCKIFCNLGLVCWEMIDWRPFYSGEKNRSSQKISLLCLIANFDIFLDLPVPWDLLCIEPKWLPTTYQKVSIVTKWGFLWQNSSWVGWDPKNFRPSGLPMRPVKRLLSFI